MIKDATMRRTTHTLTGKILFAQEGTEHLGSHIGSRVICDKLLCVVSDRFFNFKFNL